MVEHALQLVERAHLDLYTQVLILCFQVVARAVDGCLDAAGKVDVVVLEHHHVVEADAVVGAAAAMHGILLEQTHVWGRLACVKQLGVKALEHLHHAVGLGGDTRHALHEIEGSALGR